MRIGEVTASSRVPETAVRYSEQGDLLTPPCPTSSGCQKYDPYVLPRLKFIRAAQAPGCR